MSAAYAPEVAPSKEPLHGQALVDEPVVNEEIRETEERHARPDADQARPREARRLAAPHDERHREGSMEHAEEIVLLEAPRPRLVMRAVDGPEPAVPGAAMEQAGPGVHGDGGRERRRYRGPDLGKGPGGAHGSPP